MNHLAHLVVAEPTPAARLGNLIADFLKPMEVQELPADIRRGVMQHRAVDGFTDRHPAVFRAMRRLPESWGWYKGIVLDVYFDYVLIQCWDEFDLPPFRGFVEELYRDLRLSISQAPEALEDILPIIETDRLSSYQTTAGVESALRRLTGIIRARMPNRAIDLVPALADLNAERESITTEFREFFPELRRFAADWWQSHCETPSLRP